MLPKDLKDIFDEHDGDFDLHLVKAGYSGDKFTIDFAVKPLTDDDGNLVYQEWTIIASGHRKNNVAFNFAPFIEITKDHPLLWEFTDIQCQLYFTGQCQNIEKLFYELYLVHYETFGKYQPCVEMSLFKAANHFKPFQYSNGLLAQGAKKLMEKYAACLKENGLAFTFLDERPPGHYYGQQFIPAKNLKVLLMGDTYLIAEDFTFVKQPLLLTPPS